MKLNLSEQTANEIPLATRLSLSIDLNLCKRLLLNMNAAVFATTKMR
jgi:hypothetical protein